MADRSHRRPHHVGVRLQPAAVGTVLRATDRFIAARDRRWRPVRGRVAFTLYGGALGAGYGHPTPEAMEGARKVEELTGASGEVTYSGKALAGLRAIARSPRYRGKTILLWNTLSTPRPRTSDTPFPPALAWMFEGAPVA